MKTFLNIVMVLCVAIILVVLIVLLLSADNNQETTVKLFGVAITALATLLGIAFKNSMDERIISLNEQAEKRLKIDTEISAVKLLTTSSGEPAPPDQKSGALFALANSKQEDFAVHLLQLSLEKDEIPAQPAIWILNTALKSDLNDTQRSAAFILNRFHEKFVTNTIIAYPDIIYQYPYNWDLSTRQNICFMFAKGIMNAHQNSVVAIRSLYTYISCFFLTESKTKDDGVIFFGLALCLAELLHLIENVPEVHPFNPRKRIRFETIERILQAHFNQSITTTQDFIDLSNRIKDWLGELKRTA